ncbi:hypothetical protein PENTCL1PPCAC_4560, partial [Pristionchus entomophagus]
YLSSPLFIQGDDGHRCLPHSSPGSSSLQRRSSDPAPEAARERREFRLRGSPSGRFPQSDRRGLLRRGVRRSPSGRCPDADVHLFPRFGAGQASIRAASPSPQHRDGEAAPSRGRHPEREAGIRTHSLIIPSPCLLPSSPHSPRTSTLVRTTALRARPSKCLLISRYD